VQVCAAAAGLQVLDQRDAALRQEHGKDVAGMLFLLRRS
jgi:predicted TPR repeat methyltransferase